MSNPIHTRPAPINQIQIKLKKPTWDPEEAKKGDDKFINISPYAPM